MLHPFSSTEQDWHRLPALLALSALLMVMAAACSAPTPQSGVTTLEISAAEETATAPETDVSTAGNLPAPSPDAADATPAADDASADVVDTATSAAEPTNADGEVAGPTVDGAAAPEAITGNPLDHTINILLLGSDRRPDTPNWRTDVMMILALDQENGRAGVISIPRDVYVDEIPNHQPNRINVVDYLGEQDDPDGGGPALLGGIIEERMGIHIDHYVRFDFESFRDVVDALGGVEVDVDCEFRGYIEDEGGWLVLEPGLNRLAGNQAMIYVRDRQLTGGDLERARRQQRFVWAVRNQVLTENLITRLPALYSALSGAIDTDLGLIRTLQFARFAVGLDADDLYGMVVGPPDMIQEGWRDGMAVFVPDWPLIAENVQQVFAHEPFLIDNTPVDCRP